MDQTERQEWEICKHLLEFKIYGELFIVKMEEGTILCCVSYLQWFPHMQVCRKEQQANEKTHEIVHMVLELTRSKIGACIP